VNPKKDHVTMGDVNVKKRQGDKTVSP
jgi:hypothetical protein